MWKLGCVKNIRPRQRLAARRSICEAGVRNRARYGCCGLCLVRQISQFKARSFGIEEGSSHKRGLSESSVLGLTLRELARRRLALQQTAFCEAERLRPRYDDMVDHLHVHQRECGLERLGQAFV